MNDHRTHGRLGWLGLLLAHQRNNLAELMHHLKVLGLRVTTSLAVHHKFIRIMEQVSLDRDKELALLHEIETVEKRHENMKLSKRLRSAEQAHTPQPVHPDQAFISPDKPDSSMGLLTIFLLFQLFKRRPINNKNQRLTVD